MKKELVLIDSNIWLYSFLRVEDKSKYEYITKFLKEIITNSYIVITTQIINEVSYNLKRKGNFTEEEIRLIIQKFNDKFIMIEFTIDILLKASYLREKYNFSFWDSLIVGSAIKSGCKRLYSEDMQDGLIVENELKIINPFKIT